MRTLITLVTCLALALPGAPGALGAQPADTLHRAPEPLFTKRDPLIAAGFVVGTIVMFPLDRKIAERLQDSTVQAIKFAKENAEWLQPFGYPGSLIIGGSLYVIGRITDQKEMADLGLHGTEAIVLGEGIAGLIKALAGRQRPYVDVTDPRDFGFGRGFKDDSYRSFPSGHSVAGFAAAAAVVSETNRWWPKSTWYIAPVMYGGATLIGLSRMYDNKHWASDVVMGAAIGSFAGRKIVRFHHSHPSNDIDRILLGVNIVPHRDGALVAFTIAPEF